MKLAKWRVLKENEVNGKGQVYGAVPEHTLFRRGDHVSAIRRLKIWWKATTGRDDTPLDGETPYWVFSLLFHVALLLALATFLIDYDKYKPVSVNLSPSVPQVVEMPALVEIEYEDEFDEVGANEDENFAAIMNMAPTAEDMAEVEVDVQQQIRDMGEITLEEFIPEFDSEVDTTSLAVNGVAGHATNNTDGAVDRITQEILLSLEENKTLVVWMFDQSASLLKQRDEILRKFENVYDELGQLQEDGNQAFKKHDDKNPLLTQVVAFGSQHSMRLKKPTTSVPDVVQSIRDIPIDESGVENVFSAVAEVGRKYRNLCKVDRKTGLRKRNVMIVIVSDECGDDIQNVDAAISICRRNLMRVYTIGIPAPFGRENAYVKWVDPDPQFDQEVQWAPVRQGPETVRPERIKLHFTENEEEEELFDSGFGPIGLTRLCYQTGGIYFTVHPNRKLGGQQVPRWETSTYSAHLQRFFDPEVMRRYRPDYVSAAEYDRQLQQNKARYALVQAGYTSRVKPMTPPTLRFEKLDEAAFINQVGRAQRSAAELAPKIVGLYEILKTGEKDRDREISLRWKAGYDLAMGRTLAVMIRAGTYNTMLAQIKTGMKFKNPKSNTWLLKPANVITTGSQTEKLASKARTYLDRVVNEHPDTPWALLAQRELGTPIGWVWEETYTRPPEPRAPRPRNNNNNNVRPRPQMEPNTPPPRRPPPKL